MANFGLKQIGKVTPTWAKNIFRIYFFMSKALIAYGTAVNIIDKIIMNNITLFVTLFLDPVIYGFTKMFGMTSEELDTQRQEDETNKA